MTGDPQKWLQAQVENELKLFSSPTSRRVIPNNWIIATNVDPSATSKTGSFDKIIALVKKFSPDLAKHTSIWVGKKIIDLLVMHPEISRHYGGLLTSGDVIDSLLKDIGDRNANIETIVRHLIIDQLGDQQYTKLEQAGSSTDTRPGIQTLFTDLPFTYGKRRYPAALSQLTKALAENHAPLNRSEESKALDEWRRHPSRSRTWFIRGGPGQGKSTITQFVCQIHRAAFVNAQLEMAASAKLHELALDIKQRAEMSGYLPHVPRVPIHVELRLYAHWYGGQPETSARGVLSYLAARLSKDLEQAVLVGTLKRAFSTGRWLFAFDGLDEVPGDVKDLLAAEINRFIDGTLLECRSDAMVICTSRPQGYSGQFDELRPTLVDLAQLRPEEALACADPVLAIDRSSEELSSYRAILRDAIDSASIQEIMTTPLQSHIMAVVIRDGGRPPERKWQLFSNFYQVIKKREANRNLADPKIAGLLRTGDHSIKALHNRLGFELHYRAEKSSGAQTSISRDDLNRFISEIVTSLQDDDVDSTITILEEATTERLVLVSTPENGHSVRFDIRPLQEFFAAEYLCESAHEEGFMDRLRTIATDSHWSEVVHFLISALVEGGRRRELAQAVDVLADIDNSPIDQRRALARRLCTGGMMTSRLLREGVIESDKRNRAVFRKCLPALLASTDARILMPWAPPQHSAAWLGSVVHDTLAENAPGENIGAACIAPVVIQDSSAYADPIRKVIELCDLSYLEIFVDSVAVYPPSEYGKYLPLWVYKALLSRLLTDEWLSMNPPLLQSIYILLSSDPEKFRECCTASGISPEAQEILYGFFRSYDASGKASSSSRFGGLISGEVFHAPEEFNNFSWSSALISELSQLGGVATACTYLVEAALNRTDENLSRLDNLIQNSVGGYFGLPTSFRELFFEELQSPDSSVGLRSLLKSTNNGKYTEYRIDAKSDEEIDWRECLARFPSLGLFYINRASDAIEKSFHDWLSDSTNSSWYIDILTSTHWKRGVTLGQISALVKHAPHEASRLKNALALAEVGHDGATFEQSTAEMVLTLPNDADLLPHVVAQIIQVRPHHYRTFDDRAGFADPMDLVSLYIGDFKEIELIWTREEHSDSVLAAAGILMLAFSEKRLTQDGAHLDKLVDLYSEDRAEWFLRAALQFVTPAVRQRNEMALKFADDLLTVARGDLRARHACEDIIADWRQITHAPVHETLATGIWST